MKTHILCTFLFAVPAIVSAQDATNVISTVVHDAAMKMNRARASFIKNDIGEQYTDKLAIELILRHQYVSTIEFLRELQRYPDLTDQSKRYDLANLQANLNIYVRSQNSPLPQDLQEINANKGRALQAIISLETERATRAAHNPYVSTEPAQEREEQKQLTGLKSQYESYSKQLTDLMNSKYGIDSASYYQVLSPILNSAVTAVLQSSTPETRQEALKALFDGLIESA